MLDSTGVESLHVLVTFKRPPNFPRLFRTCPSNGNNRFLFRHCLLLLAFSFTPAAPRLARPLSFSHLFGLACLLHFLFRFGCPEKLYTHICCASIAVSLCVCECARGVRVCVCLPLKVKTLTAAYLLNLPNCLALLSQPACCPTRPRALSLSIATSRLSLLYAYALFSLLRNMTYTQRVRVCVCVASLSYQATLSLAFVGTHTHR